MNKTAFLTADLSNGGHKETLKHMVRGNNVICHWSCKNIFYNNLTEVDCNSDSIVVQKDVDDLLKYFVCLFLWDSTNNAIYVHTAALGQYVLITENWILPFKWRNNLWLYS